MKYVIRYQLPNVSRFYYFERFQSSFEVIPPIKPKGLDFRPYNNFFSRVKVFDCIKDAAFVVKLLQKHRYFCRILPLSYFLSDHFGYRLSREYIEMVNKWISAPPKKLVDCCPSLDPECFYGCDKEHPGCPFKKKGADRHEGADQHECCGDFEMAPEFKEGPDHNG